MIMNKYKIFKRIRILCSLLVLLIFLSIFLLTENIFATAADWQFVPALIRTITFFTLGILVFFIVATILFGRIYCSFICPLGVLQDIAIRLGKIFKLHKKKKLFTRKHRRLRYLLLAILLGAILILLFVNLISQI